MVLAVLAGGLMLTRWSEFHYLFPLGGAGAIAGASVGSVVARLAPRAWRSRVIFAVAGVAILVFQGLAADIEWANWADPVRQSYFLGGLEALMLAWVLSLAAMWFLVRSYRALGRRWSDKSSSASAV